MPPDYNGMGCRPTLGLFLLALAQGRIGHQRCRRSCARLSCPFCWAAGTYLERVGGWVDVDVYLEEKKLKFCGCNVPRFRDDDSGSSEASYDTSTVKIPEHYDEMPRSDEAEAFVSGVYMAVQVTIYFIQTAGTHAQLMNE